jgi:hypothetical protein
MQKRVRTTLLSLFILVVLVVLLYFLGVRCGQLEFVHALFLKVTLSLGVRSLSVLLLKVGCSGFIISAIGFAVRAILATEATPYVSMVLPAEERASSPLPPIPSPGSTGSSWIEETYRGGAEASSSAPLQQQGASSHTNPNGSPSLSEQFPILKMPSPKLREMQELLSHFRYENEASSSAREMAGPSNATFPLLSDQPRRQD